MTTIAIKSSTEFSISSAEYIDHILQLVDGNSPQYPRLPTFQNTKETEGGPDTGLDNVNLVEEEDDEDDVDTDLGDDDLDDAALDDEDMEDEDTDTSNDI